MSKKHVGGFELFNYSLICITVSFSFPFCKRHGPRIYVMNPKSKWLFFTTIISDEGLF